MSGHSKWAQIKRQKGAADLKKGRIFSRLSKAIILAAREKGGDPETNFALRLAVEKAKQANMPQANIERAIKKGMGEAGGEKMEEVFCEIYGPGGAAIIVQAITDNKNRTISELKNTLTKSEARLGESNSVRWLFEERGVIIIRPEKSEKEALMLAAIEAGAEDIKEGPEETAVIVKKENFHNAREALEKKIKIDSAEIELRPKNPLEITDPKILRQIRNLIEKLEENEDTVNLFTNLKEAV